MLIIRHLEKAKDLGGMLSGPNKDSIGKLACLFRLMEQSHSSISISNLPHKEGDNNIKLCYKLIVENNYDEFINYIKGYSKYYKELINRTISAVKNTLNSIK